MANTFTLRAAARTSLAATLAAAMAGCASWGKVPTEADFAQIRPGMTGDAVVAQVGRPQWRFGVRYENLTVLNYRYNHNDCVIYQISMKPDGTVHDIAPGYDPACDGPKDFR